MNTERLSEFVKRIETELIRIERHQVAFKGETAHSRESIAFAYKQAKESGIDPRALRAAIKVRTVERKISDLSSVAAYEQIQLHLGDLMGTPLGNYAVKQVNYVEPAEEKKRRGRPPKIEIEKVPTVAPHGYASDVTG